MPYKPYTGNPGLQANQQVKPTPPKNGTAMATKERGQPIPALGQDVVMDDAFAAVGGAAGAVAAANAAGKKGFFKGKFGGVSKPKPVSAAVRKKRMNFRLRKILTPKSPLMVLNEIVVELITPSLTLLALC